MYYIEDRWQPFAISAPKAIWMPASIVCCLTHFISSLVLSGVSGQGLRSSIVSTEWRSLRSHGDHWKPHSTYDTWLYCDFCIRATKVSITSSRITATREYREWYTHRLDEVDNYWGVFKPPYVTGPIKTYITSIRSWKDGNKSVE